MTREVQLETGQRSLKSKPLVIIDWTLKVSWWLLIVVTILALIFVPVLLFNAEEGQADWSLTTAAKGLDLSELEATDSTGQSVQVELPVDSLFLKIDTPLKQTNKPLFLSGIVLLVGSLAAFWLYIIRTLRQIVSSVKSGDPFIPSNAKRIRIIGTLLIFGSLVTTLAEGLLSVYAFKEYSTTGFEFVISFDFNWTAIFLGLGILALSEVFREGTRIREEQALTI